MASAQEGAVKAQKKAEISEKKAKKAEGETANLKAEQQALYTGDAKSPRLTLKGRKLAAALTGQSAEEHETETKRLKRQVASAVAGKERAQKLVEAAEARTAKSKEMRSTATAKKKQAVKELAKI